MNLPDGVPSAGIKDKPWQHRLASHRSLTLHAAQASGLQKSALDPMSGSACGRWLGWYSKDTVNDKQAIQFSD